jgi:hypothetical protein
MSRPSAPRFQVYQRESKTYLLTFTSPDEVDCDTASATYNPNGVVDLSLATVYYRWKKNVDDPDPPIIDKDSLTVTEIEILTQTALPWDENSTRGQAKVYLVPDDTHPVNNTEIAKLEDRDKIGTFHFDAWAVFPGGIQKIVVVPTPIDLLEAVTDL